MIKDIKISLAVLLPPDQLHPDSILQVELHPSPLLMFLSSHASVPVLYPSPQIEGSTLILYGEEPNNVGRNILLFGIKVDDTPG